MHSDDWLPGANWSRMSEKRHKDVDRWVMAAVMVAFFYLVLGAQRGWF